MPLDFRFAESAKGETQTEITRLDWLVSMLALQQNKGSRVEGRDWFGFSGDAERRLEVDADGVALEDIPALRFSVGVDAATDKAAPAQWPAGHTLNHCHSSSLFRVNQCRGNGLALDGSDLGPFAATGLAGDRGKFEAPSLRNTALTAPCMHEGRLASLEELIEHYDSGVRRNASPDPNLAKHPDTGLQLAAEEKRGRVAFLRTLTDESFTHADPATAPLASRAKSSDAL